MTSWRIIVIRMSRKKNNSGRNTDSPDPSARKAHPAVPGFFDTKLILVAGKGGVGKTTIAAVLAGEAVRRRKKTLVVTIDGLHSFSGLFGDTGGHESGKFVEISPKLHTLDLNRQLVIDDYIKSSIPIRSVRRMILNSTLYQYVTAVAPGIRELLILDRIRKLAAGRRNKTGRKKVYDLVIADFPATGHGISYLTVPGKIMNNIALDPVHKIAARLKTFLEDPGMTSACLVTLAEEMPVREAGELYRELTERHGLSIPAVIVNCVYPGCQEDGEILPSMIDDIDPDVYSPLALPSNRSDNGYVDYLQALIRCRNFACKRRKTNLSHIKTLNRSIPCPLIIVPLLPDNISSSRLNNIREIISHQLGELKPPTEELT